LIDISIILIVTYHRYLGANACIWFLYVSICIIKYFHVIPIVLALSEVARYVKSMPSFTIKQNIVSWYIV
jgi:hypothetical protein